MIGEIVFILTQKIASCVFVYFPQYVNTTDIGLLGHTTGMFRDKMSMQHILWASGDC